MRKAVALPTMGMAIGFFVGIAIGYFFGINFIQVASNIASEFFLSLGVIVGTAFGIVLLILIGILFVKAWYFMAPFVIGLICGVVLSIFLASAFFSGLTSSSAFIVTRGMGRKAFNCHGLRPYLFHRSVGN